MFLKGEDERVELALSTVWPHSKETNPKASLLQPESAEMGLASLQNSEKEMAAFESFNLLYCLCQFADQDQNSTMV